MNFCRGLKKGDIVVFNSPYDTQLLLLKRITQIIEKGDTLPINRRTLPQYRPLILRDGGSVSETQSGIFVNGKRLSSGDSISSYSRSTWTNRFVHPSAENGHLGG